MLFVWESSILLGRTWNSSDNRFVKRCEAVIPISPDAIMGWMNSEPEGSAGASSAGGRRLWAALAYLACNIVRFLQLNSENSWKFPGTNFPHTSWDSVHCMASSLSCWSWLMTKAIRSIIWAARARKLLLWSCSSPRLMLLNEDYLPSPAPNDPTKRQQNSAKESAAHCLPTTHFSCGCTAEQAGFTMVSNALDTCGIFLLECEHIACDEVALHPHHYMTHLCFKQR